MSLEKVYKARKTPSLKRGLMKRGYICLIVVLVLFAVAAAADSKLQDECRTTDDCIYICEDLLGLSSDCYCQQGFCYLRSASGSSASNASSNLTANTTTKGAAGNVSVPAVSYASVTELNLVKTDISAVKQSVASVESSVISLQSDLNNLNNQFLSLQQTLQQTADSLANQQNNLDALREELGLEIKAVATGLAGLQNTLDVTQSEVSSLEGTLAEKPGSFFIILSVIIILIVIGSVLITIYYVEKNKHPGINLGDAIVDYINHHIKAGRKYRHIQGDLLKAGWKHDEIKTAYQTVAKANYQTYLKGKSSGAGSSVVGLGSAEENPLQSTSIGPGNIRPSMGSAPLPSSQDSSGFAFGSDKSKIIIIAMVSLLLISGVVFILSTSSGQAIYLKKGILDTGEVVHQIECTPPHVLTPDGDACCLDENANTICDLTEQREAELQQAESLCTDNLQCSDGKLCINQKCTSVDELYQGSEICDKQCAYYSTRILTSDKESYYLQPGKGSYTAAGAVEWKLLATGKHCNGEEAIIPVKLIYKNQGKILGEEVITLHSGESSRAITHPQISSVTFSLTLDEVYEVCE
ncbi:hypothetical protein HYT52_03860 [Candidatus Woesearchaeota archaeon]|nr:hypothetical protein [Candidatus Woesearchaeota archaeon]